MNENLTELYKAMELVCGILMEFSNIRLERLIERAKKRKSGSGIYITRQQIFDDMAQLNKLRNYFTQKLKEK